jgi:hypothetical protein
LNLLDSAAALQDVADFLTIPLRTTRSWIDKDGERQRGHTFIVTGFLFGATHGGHGSPIARRGDRPHAPLSDANAAEAEEEVAA